MHRMPVRHARDRIAEKRFLRFAADATVQQTVRTYEICLCGRRLKDIVDVHKLSSPS